MKRNVLTLTIFTGLVVIALTWPSSKPQLFAADGYDGQAACQACDDNADAMYQQCIAVFGEGDADCMIQSESYRANCKVQYCISTFATLFTTASDMCTPTAYAAAPGCSIENWNTCIGAADVQEAVCLSQGGSKESCAGVWNQFFDSCMRDKGCPEWWNF